MHPPESSLLILRSQTRVVALEVHALLTCFPTTIKKGLKVQKDRGK